jgi:hypothetical protein
VVEKIFKVEWELSIEKKLEDAGLGYRLIPQLISKDESSGRLVRRWISVIPLEWIRDPDSRFSFWEMAGDTMNRLSIKPEDREVPIKKLARVVEPVTEAEARIAANHENVELKDAFSSEIELMRAFKENPTPEKEALLREARSHSDQLWKSDHEKRKTKYREETEG